jgi:hypothetical protein
MEVRKLACAFEKTRNIRQTSEGGSKEAVSKLKHRQFLTPKGLDL